MKKPTILIADDHVDSADALGILMGLDFPELDVAVTYGGQEALQSASRQRPDVALLDMEMPEMDGETLAHALQAMYPGQSPVMIAVSANLERLNELRGNGLFDQCLDKPVDADAILRIVRERLTSIEDGPSGALKWSGQ
jgi:CheY-like chemotaxis protein